MSMMPIEIELLRHSLASICDEMYVAIMRGAYSTNIEERRDHSAAIFDSHGRVVVQGESLPLHIASMLGLIDVVLERYGSIAFSRATCSSPTTRLPAADRISRGRAAGARLPQRRAGPVRERHRAPCGHRRNGAGRHDRDLSGGSANSADSIDRQGTDRRGGPVPGHALTLRTRAGNDVHGARGTTARSTGICIRHSRTHCCRTNQRRRTGPCPRRRGSIPALQAGGLSFVRLGGGCGRKEVTDGRVLDGRLSS
jgi:hypothetical protein